MSAVGDELEMQLLLEAIYQRFHHDFRHYARASLRRRLQQAMVTLECASLSALQARVLHEPGAFANLLEHLTVRLTDLFRDPPFYAAVRRDVLPLLATYPSLKVWVAGCSSGEEAYSFAILLAEAGLLERTLVYATDIHAGGLCQGRAGVYPLARARQFTLNHRAAGACRSLSDYYHVSGEQLVMSRALREHITFADHSLATDAVFSEVQLVSCRNVLIYFDPALQERALGLFTQALCPQGFLCLGNRESVRFSRQGEQFTEVDARQRIYRRSR